MNRRPEKPSFACVIFLVAILTFSGWSCSRQISQDDVIVRVNEREITVRQFLNLFESMKPKDTQLQGVERAKIKNLSLQALVVKNVILSTAEAQNISVDSKELQAALDRYKEGYGERLFRETLLEGMLEETEWVEQIKQNLLIEKLFKASKKEVVAPTLEEAHTFFEENQNLFSKAGEARAEHIVVGDSEQAKQIRDEWQKSPRRFLDLAKAHSTGPEAQSDGVLIVETGILPEALDKAMFSLPLKQISPIIETEYGFHIVRVLSRKEAVNLDFNQVKNEIFARLYEQKKELWLTRFEQDLIRQAEIQYDRELISKL